MRWTHLWKLQLRHVVFPVETINQTKKTTKKPHHSFLCRGSHRYLTKRELYICKKGSSQLYFGFLVIQSFWVCQTFQSFSKNRVNVHPFNLEIWTLKMKCNTVDMHFIRFSKAEEILGGFWGRWFFQKANVESTGMSSDGYCSPAALSICLQLTSK